MFYFTCNESKIYESFTFWNKLQEKNNFFHHILIFWDVPVYRTTWSSFLGSKKCFSIDASLRTASCLKTLGENSLFSDNWSLFNNAVLLHGHWFRSPPKPARMGGASGYIMRAFAIGSSDFFSFSDKYKTFALRDLKPSPLNEPSQRIQTSLCLATSPLHSRPQHLQQMVFRVPCRYPVTLSSEHISKEQIYSALLQMPHRFCRSCRGANTASVFHAWAPPTLKQHSPRRNVPIAGIWVSPLCARG